VCLLDSQLRTMHQLTALKRQNEPEPMGKEEAESKKDPTLPVRLFWLMQSRLRVD